MPLPTCPLAPLRKTLALLVLCFFILPIAAHSADRRVALVMGNGAYAGSAKLKNAVADAKLMARTLEGLDFKVTLLTDVQTEEDMKRALVQFKRRLPEAEVALVYFSGHGVQTERGNYLLPVQGDYQREADFDSQAVSLNYVLDQFRGSRAAGLVILDACRDNPFRSSTRSATRGLRREEPPNGLLIAYSTAQNQTAADGSGTNGLYTKHLAHFLSQKGLSVDEVFDQTAKQVKLESRGDQSPREDSDIRDKLYLNGTPQIAAAPAPVAGDDGLEAQAWRDAQSVGTTAVYRAFIEGFPQSRYTAAARIKLAAAEQREKNEAAEAEAAAAASLLRERAQTEAKAWQEAQAADTVEGYRAFIDTYPQSPNLKAAQRKLAAAEKAETAEQAQQVANAWRTAQKEDTVEGYEAFLNAYASSGFASAAKQKLEASRVLQAKYRIGNTFRDCPECPEMIVIPSGELKLDYWRGRNEDDTNSTTTIKFDKPIAIAKFETKQKEWKFLLKKNPSYFFDCDECPVENMTWNEAVNFTEKLSKKTGKKYELPSASEWIYACKAGELNKYCGGSNLEEVAWYFENKDATQRKGFGNFGNTHPAGGKKPNKWGIYDMTGNVSEWVKDCHPNGERFPPPENGTPYQSTENCYREFKGGGVFSQIQYFKNYFGGSVVPQHNPDFKGLHAPGFRVVRRLD